MKKKIFILLSFLFLATAAKSQDFIYQPINPAFGGSPLNYSWLLSSAQAQNKHEDPARTNSLLNRDPLNDFEQSLNRQLLNQLSRQIINTQFGEEGLKDGEYVVGSYLIEVTSGNAGINLRINDTATGNSTTVLVPYF